MVTLDTLESTTHTVTAGLPQFTYEPLGKDEDTRLLTISEELCNGMISCTLSSRVRPGLYRDSVSSYSCLSYVWGTGPTNRSILINGAFFYVKQNLYDFLERARHRFTHMLIWIDAICINQNDISERNTQVQRMAAIYSGCRQVLVWLGLAPELDVILEITIELSNAARENGISNDAIMNRHRHFGAFAKSWEKIRGDHLLHKFQSDQERCLVGFEALASHPYQYRAWIVQELTMSETALLVNGHHAVSFEALEQSFGGELSIPLEAPPLHEQVYLLYKATSWPALWTYWNGMSGGFFSHHDIPRLIEYFAAHGCSDPRDRLYSMVGLIHQVKTHDVQARNPYSYIPEVDYLRVDYLEPRKELFWRALAYLEGPPYHSNSASTLSIMLDLCQSLEVTVQELETPVKAVVKTSASGLLFLLSKVRVLAGLDAPQPFAQCPFAAHDRRWFQNLKKGFFKKDYAPSQQLARDESDAMTTGARDSTQSITLIACTTDHWDDNHDHITFHPTRNGIYEVSKIGCDEAALSTPLLHVNQDGKTRPVTSDDFVAYSYQRTRIRYGVYLPRVVILALMKRYNIKRTVRREDQVKYNLQQLRLTAARLHRRAGPMV